MIYTNHAIYIYILYICILRSLSLGRFVRFFLICLHFHLSSNLIGYVHFPASSQCFFMHALSTQVWLAFLFSLTSTFSDPFQKKIRNSLRSLSFSKKTELTKLPTDPPTLDVPLAVHVRLEAPAKGLCGSIQPAAQTSNRQWLGQGCPTNKLARFHFWEIYPKNSIPSWHLGHATVP